MALTRTFSWLALAVLTTFLAGCATQPGTVIPDTAWEQRRAAIAALDEFKADGKLALRTSERSESASMVWVQSGDSSYVNLSGPLGTGATNLHSDGKTVTITRNGETKSYDADTYETLDEFGIPIGTVGYWARGIPDPSLPVEALSVEDDLLRSLTQAGWIINYTRYDYFGRYTLPTRIQLSKDDTRVRIFLYAWSVAAP